MGVREATTASFRPPPLGGGHGRALTCLSTSLILLSGLSSPPLNLLLSYSYRSSYIGIAGRLSAGDRFWTFRRVVDDLGEKADIVSST
ncbi:hypothetical protein KY289_002909 [Solanum tuberosum]|nr:hypothetical protein KY289_002909 [Solanum tuberosum]